MTGGGDLDELRWHWDTAYVIFHPEPDVWVAARRDDHATLYASTPLGLRDKIHADYQARPVSRWLHGHGEPASWPPGRSRFTVEG